MDVAAISQMISTVGFPIACTIALFYMLNKTQEQHKQESEKWIDALNNNTNVMTRIVDFLKIGDDLK